MYYNEINVNYLKTIKDKLLSDKYVQYGTEYNVFKVDFYVMNL